MKIMRSLACIICGLFLGAAGMYWYVRRAEPIDIQPVACPLSADFEAQRACLVDFVYTQIKKQCSYLANTPDFISKLTPYHKHKESCVILLKNFFGQKERCEQTFNAIGSNEHQNYIQMVLREIDQTLATHPALDGMDILNDILSRKPYRQIQPGVYDDAYFEQTALSLLIIAAYKLDVWKDKITTSSNASSTSSSAASSSAADSAPKKIKKGRSKWRWKKTA